MSRVHSSGGCAAVALAIALAALGSCRVHPESCSQCGRAECGNMAFTVRLDNGKKVETCCPRCGLHYIETESPQVAGLSVRAFDTAEPLEARSAVYVEGSDVTPCVSMNADSPRDERGCCLKPVYDRCLPSLLAFKTRTAAEAFSRDHGGEVKGFADIAKERERAAPSGA